MLTCKEASLLASKAMDVKLTWRERLSLTVHIAMCDLCRRHARDMKKLRKIMRKAGASGALLSESIKLSERSRQRIKKAMDKALNSSK